MSVDLVFVGEFLDTNGAGVTGLTVTVDVDAWARATGARTAIATAQAATEGRNGHYAYRVASCDLAANHYVATFKTASTTPVQSQVSCSTFLGADVLVSSRLAAADAVTAGDVADAVLDEALSEHTTAGTPGQALNYTLIRRA